MASLPTVPGVDVPVVSTDSEDWRSQLHEALGGRALQVVGGALAVELTGLLADGGTLLT
jgi:hypothetical protein